MYYAIDHKFIGREQRLSLYHNKVYNLPKPDYTTFSKLNTTERMKRLLQTKYLIHNDSEITTVSYQKNEIEKYTLMIIRHVDFVNSFVNKTYKTTSSIINSCLNKIYYEDNIVQIHHFDRSVYEGFEFKDKYRNLLDSNSKFISLIDQYGKDLLIENRKQYRIIPKFIRKKKDERLIKLDIENAYNSTLMSKLIQYLMDNYYDIDIDGISCFEILVTILLFLNGPKCELNGGLVLGSVMIDVLFEFYFNELLKPFKPLLLFVDDFVIKEEYLYTIEDLLKKHNYNINKSKLKIYDVHKNIEFCKKTIKVHFIDYKE